MTAFRLEKRPSGARWKGCENGCRTTRDGIRPATHVAWIIDWPVYLCSRCSEAWVECWDGAHVEQGRAVVVS